MLVKRPHKEGQKYTILPKSSIQLSAETIGLEDLSDDVIEVVCEDVNYRLRELVQAGMDRMIRCKRVQLTSRDINNSLQTLGHQIIYGHTDLSEGSLDFNYIPKANIYVNEDKIIDLFKLADSVILPEYINHGKDMEMMKEGAVVMEEGKMDEGDAMEANEPDATPNLHESSFFSRSWLVSENMPALEANAPSPLSKQLVIETFKAFLSDDMRLYKNAYSNLHSLQSINLVLDLFLDSMPEVLSNLSSPDKRRRIFHLLHAIITSAHVHLNFPAMLQKIVHLFVRSIQREPKTLNSQKSSSSSVSVDFDEVIFVFGVAATFIRRWSSRECRLRRMLVQGLKEVLLNLHHLATTPSLHPAPSSSPLHNLATIAATIIAFNCLGVKTMSKHLLPLLLPLIDKVQSSKTPIHPPIHPLIQAPILPSIHLSLLKPPHHHHHPSSHGNQALNGYDCFSQALIMSLQQLVKWQNLGHEGHNACSETSQRIWALYRKLVELFGDGVLMMMPEWRVEGKGEGVEIKLTDENSFKTGEQLIEEMMREGVEEREEGKSDKAADMSVKTSFSDAHIKLTIAKKVSKTAESSEGTEARGRRSQKAGISELFDRAPLKRADEALITFKFKSRNFLSTFLEKRKALLLARNMARQHASVSRYRQLCKGLPLHGRAPSRQAPTPWAPL